ncbi:MAG TPA: PAS domain-containing protein [Sphingomicrobium sp.]|nr:PAS domain-containing protein [Sphingomicrobium sp.]
MPRSQALGRPSFLSGGGEVRDLIAEFDWGSTSLGPINDWPAVVKTTVALILQSPVPVVTLWGDAGVMIYNDAYAQFAGARHPQILGLDVLDAWPEVADWNRNVMETVFHRGETISVQDEKLVLERHGKAEPAWLNLDYSPVVDDDGNIAAVIAIVVETTAKVRAEQRISGERERLRRMFDAAPGFTALLEGKDHRFVMANAAYERLVGRSVIGKSVHEALPEVAEQGFISLLDNVAQSGEPFIGRAIPVRLGSADETQEKFVDFVYQPIADEDGKPIGIFVQGYDVTDHKRAEALRIVHNEVLELAIEDKPLGKTLEALARTVESHSRSGVIASILLLDRDGRHLRHGAAPSLPEEYNKAIDGLEIGPDVGSCGTAAFTGQAVFVSDIANDPKWKDFRDLAAEHGLGACWSVPIVSGTGKVLGTFAMYHREPREPVPGDLELVDLITRSASMVISRKQAETALRELNETLEARVVEEIAERRAAEVALQQAQKMESIGKLTGGVAHDFNNLLQIISGNLQLLQAEIPPGGKAERRITNAMAGVQRGAKLASQLLAFGRRQPLEPKVINFGRLVGGMEDLLRRSIGEGVEMETIVSPSLWNAFADPTQVENAILNLAINARDAMDGMGKLTIEVRNAHLDHHYSQQNPGVEPGQYVMLAVSDTGSGMSSELLDRVFEPFFTTKPEGKGSGLGLSMVYGFAKQSGGHVKIYSEIGEGTTVRLYLPRVHENEDIAAGPELVEAGGGSETILVVEDDAEVRSTVTDLLRELGYKVLTAKDASSAVPILESGVKIDLLFTDVVMPGPVRSPELARKARELIPGIAILFTSGYTENAVVHGGRLDPGVNLLAKPYSRAALATRIRDALKRTALVH